MLHVVAQARDLTLVDDTSSDDAVRRALEDRWLILNEIGRGAPLSPASDAGLAARRGEWSWIRRVTHPLPVPVSPAMGRVMPDPASRSKNG